MTSLRSYVAVDCTPVRRKKIPGQDRPGRRTQPGRERESPMCTRAMCGVAVKSQVKPAPKDDPNLGGRERVLCSPARRAGSSSSPRPNPPREAAPTWEGEREFYVHPHSVRGHPQVPGQTRPERQPQPGRERESLMITRINCAGLSSLFYQSSDKSLPCRPSLLSALAPREGRWVSDPCPPKASAESFAPIVAVRPGHVVGERRSALWPGSVVLSF